MTRWGLRTVFFLFLLSPCAPAQEFHRQYSWDLAFAGGYSPTSVVLLGTDSHKWLLRSEVRLRWTLLTHDKFALKYVGTLVPAAITERRGDLVESGDEVFHLPDTVVYGFGADPLGLQLNLLPRKRVQPFINGQGGFLRFSREAPVESASRFNYVFSAGAGVEVFATPRHSWSVAYRYHHYSNGGRAALNFGVDSHMVVGEYAFKLN